MLILQQKIFKQNWWRIKQEIQKHISVLQQWYQKFILLLRKGAYPYEYMDHWEMFNEIALPEKEEFFSNLNMEDITDADYIHSKRICKDFEIKNVDEYHDLYFKKDTLLLADVFETFWKMCLKLYH